MQTKDLISQVRKIEIKTRKIVDELVGGAYHSRFKGRGIEFEEVREYVPGDDIRDIDWNVTARMGYPFVKKYIEERELHVLLAVDLSNSMLFGSSEKTKLRVEAELVALLGLSAIRNNDKVGLITFTDKIESHLPLRSGRSHILRMIRELVAHPPIGKKTNLSNMLSHLRQTLTKRTVIFLISDFLTDEKDFSKNLQILSKKHDVILIHISDSIEKRLNLHGNWTFEDSENGLLGSIFCNKKSRESYLKLQQLREEQLEREALRAKAGKISITCGEDIINPLLKFFKKNKRN